MSRIKAMVVFGTRPEAIKMCPVVKRLKEHEIFEVSVVVTGQHREMLDQVLGLFDIIPDYDLDLMTVGQTLHNITVKVITGLESIINEIEPDIALVHGDTTTAFAAALAGFYQKIPVGHVEAGLRTNDKYQPFPEEMNRRLVSTLGDLHFAPTKKSSSNLIQEGIKPENIFVTGNTVIDALKMVVEKDYVFKDSELRKIDFENDKIIIVEAHRRENLGQPLERICKAILELGQSQGIQIIFPVHKNPKVREPVKRILSGNKSIKIVEPPDYLEFANLMAKSHLIITDSGGLQEEAPALGKPVLVLREVTERPEALEAGTVCLVGSDCKKIVSTAKLLLNDEAEYMNMATAQNPYGDGRASYKIADAIIDWIDIEF